MPAEASAASKIEVVYVLQSLRHRGPFLNLMSELRTATTHLLATVGADPAQYSMTEREDRDGWFVEVMHFGSEQERNRFDELYCQDRAASAIQGLLDDYVDGARSDYVLTRRQSRGCRPVSRRRGPSGRAKDL
jgi:hypothetical protein